MDECPFSCITKLKKKAKKAKKKKPLEHLNMNDDHND